MEERLSLSLRERRERSLRTEEGRLPVGLVGDCGAKSCFGAGGAAAFSGGVVGVGEATGGGEGGGGGMFVPSVREKETGSKVRGLKFTGAIVVGGVSGEAGSRDRGLVGFEA